MKLGILKRDSTFSFELAVESNLKFEERKKTGDEIQNSQKKEEKEREERRSRRRGSENDEDTG